MVEHLTTMRENQVLSLGQEDPLEKEMATHSSTLAWKISWMEEPDELQSMWLERVGHNHNQATSLSLCFLISYQLKLSNSIANSDSLILT